ncbi:LysM domain-containing protein [Thermolongibacillus altinsuensis]|jgi:LysM repeat protein|uniref:LysM domain-containing protein n=1 Tax=Thermolongibacillus altinsuensis TaxID=575256 RepID=A0A4R1QEP6_9BACL|nr:cell division suppressor protein YneA [Thermolongibacillus altinsuensis]TCL48099.1 LysM domain-containing protein [Thermolongibacillus altinsuensis]GMB09713.1 cell division suppressor protein YneA [Thermolongibacillus altinsuensis]
MSKIHYVVFSVLSFSFLVALLYATEPVEKEKYVEITVSVGDTLWNLAEKYKNEHNLSREEFIKWVMDVNQLPNGQLVAGEKIVIPVLKSEYNEPLLAGKEK